MARECLIHKCLYTGQRMCCGDCDREECGDRCLNAPERCGCVGVIDLSARRENPRRKRLTSQQRREIIALLQAGKLTYSEIARMYGVTPEAVTRYLCYVERGDGHG